MSVTPDDPGSFWALYEGAEIRNQKVIYGKKPNPGREGHPTEDQKLSYFFNCNSWYWVWDDGKPRPNDYYLIGGTFEHSVNQPDKDYTPDTNKISGGYYCSMIRTNFHFGKGVVLKDYSPRTIELNGSKSWNIGANAGFFGGDPTASVSAGYSVSWQVADTRVTAEHSLNPDGTTDLTYSIYLSAFKDSDPSNSRNKKPNPTSYVGTLADFAFIVEVPRSDNLNDEIDDSNNNFEPIDISYQSICDWHYFRPRSVAEIVLRDLVAEVGALMVSPVTGAVAAGAMLISAGDKNGQTKYDDAKEINFTSSYRIAPDAFSKANPPSAEGSL